MVDWGFTVAPKRNLFAFCFKNAAWKTISTITKLYARWDVNGVRMNC